MKNRMILLGFIAITAIIGLGFAACDGDNTPATHTHTYSTTWSHNETQHWKECTGADCDVSIPAENDRSL